MSVIPLSIDSNIYYLYSMVIPTKCLDPFFQHFPDFGNDAVGRGLSYIVVTDPLIH